MGIRYLDWSKDFTSDQLECFVIGNNGLQRDVDSRALEQAVTCLLYTSPSPRDATLSRMPSSA